MTRDSRVQLFACLALIFFMGVSVALSTSLTAVAGRSRMAAADQVEDSSSWEVSAGIAMGAFRGLFVNMLWMRANDMKEDGKFYEAVELASAITKLQPRFPRVWVFHAWNLAYNISVATQTPRERWDWVNQGIRILREKGLPANPNDMLLHKELAWIFNHKIAGYTDDANGYYKRRLAAEWTVVLGPPPKPRPEFRDRMKAIQAYVDWLTPIVEAPGSLQEVIEKTPSVAILAKRLREEAKIEQLDMTFLDKHELFRAVQGSARRAVYESDPEFDPEDYFRSLGKLIEDPTLADAWPPFIAYVRRKVLVERYCMEPVRMLQYTRKFGPLDWRCAAAHTIYWGQRGVEGGLTRVDQVNKRDYDFINTDRMVVQGVQEMFRSGELYFDFLGNRTRDAVGFWQGMPNPHFAPTYGEMIEELSARSWADNRIDRGFRPYINGYENFLRDVICFYYRRGEIQTAEEWRTTLRTMPGRNVNNPFWVEETSTPLNEWVQKELNDRFTSPYVAMAQISAALMSAFASGLLAGDDELFRSQFQYAAYAHRFYMEQQLRGNVVNRETMRMEQFERNFPFLSGLLFLQFIMTLDPDDAERVYALAPDDVKCWAYDDLANAYKKEMDAAFAEGKARSFDQAFPEPRDMASRRAEMLRVARERQQATPEVESK